jgi:hypothetical protein
VPQFSPNAVHCSTTVSPKLEDYFLLPDVARVEVCDDTAHVFGDGCSISMGTNAPCRIDTAEKGKVTFSFDLAEQRKVCLGFAYSFGASSKHMAEVKGLVSAPEHLFAGNREYWESFFASVPVRPHDELSKRLMWMWWQAASNYLESEYVTVSPAIQSSRCGCYSRMFSWDTYLSVVSLAATNMLEPAIKVLHNWLRYNQKRDGRIFQDVNLNGETYETTTYDFGNEFDDKARFLDVDALPLLAWAVMEMVKSGKSVEMLFERVEGNTLLQRVRLYMDFLEGQVEDAKDGLLVRDHYLESGWDNRISPLFDKGIKDKVINLQVFYYMSLKAMAEIYALLGTGYESMVQKYNAKAEKTKSSIKNKMWCDQHLCYEDIDIYDNKYHVLLLDTFLPLIFETDKSRIEALISHLLNEKEFNLPHGLPTVAANDSRFDIEGWGWRGNNWTSQTALVIQALQACGRVNEGLELLNKTLLGQYPFEFGEHQNPFTGEENGMIGASPYDMNSYLGIAGATVQNKNRDSYHFPRKGKMEGKWGHIPERGMRP